MAVREKSNEEVLLEQLSKHVAALASEQKAKEAAIKGLNDRMKQADDELAHKLRQADTVFELRRTELYEAIQPLEALKHEVPRLVAEIAKLKQEKLNAVSEIRAAKGGAIKEIDEQVTVLSRRHAKIEMAIQQCKDKVAGL